MIPKTMLIEYEIIIHPHWGRDPENKLMYETHHLYSTTNKFVTGFTETRHIYTHNGKERFSSPIYSTINKLTNCPNITTTSWPVCFLWGLFLRSVRHSRVLRCTLNATGWFVQAATLLKITTWHIHDVGYDSSYILQHFECNGTSF